MDLSVTIGSLTLANPLIAASGCFGYGVEYADVVDLASLGGVAVKGLFLAEREGHPPPRIVETPSGMLNAIGLQGIGVHRFIGERLPELRRAAPTVIVNICGTTLDEYVELARILSDAEGVHALELNISCPNIKEGGITFGCSLPGTHDVVSAVRKVTRLPVIPKLTPNVTDVASFARAAEDAGADAVSLVNTFLAMAIDVETRRPKLIEHRGRPQRAGHPADRGAHGLRVPPRREDPDHRHGRHRDGGRRARVHDRRRERGAGRHDEFRGPVHLDEADGRHPRLHDDARDRAAAGHRRHRGHERARAGMDQLLKDKVLVALDVESRDEALRLADTLRGAVGGFKIGSRLFTAEGPSMVRTLVERGDRVFLDLKFHDIPNTVAGAVAAATELGVWMVNVHASGGTAMMQAARAAAHETAFAEPPATPLVIAVTVFTSMSHAAPRETIGVALDLIDQVLRLAELAQSAGFDGVVASPREISSIRARCGDGFAIVTPGIRGGAAAATKDDQERTMSPADAVAAGASYLVVGRPIIAAQDPEAGRRRDCRQPGCWAVRDRLLRGYDEMRRGGSATSRVHFFCAERLFLALAHRVERRDPVGADAQVAGRG